MQQTKNRKYPLIKGHWLDDDIPVLIKAFLEIDEDVEGIDEKITTGLKNLKNEMNESIEEAKALSGNLSLLALEKSQKIKIGVIV